VEIVVVLSLVIVAALALYMLAMAIRIVRWKMRGHRRTRWRE